MDQELILNFLKENLQGLGLELAPYWENLLSLAEAMEAEAERLHLTAVKGIEARLRGPFLDSLFLAAHLPSHSPQADLGTGAGIPGLVVKIVRPELEIHLFEAYAPRVEFMREFIRRQSLEGVFVHDCHIGRSPCGLQVPVAFARGYGEVGKFVRHASEIFEVQEAYYLWRHRIEPWHPGKLPLELIGRKPFPAREIELLVWKRA